MSTKRVYTDAGQTAILSLQRQGGRLVRMQRDGKRPAFKWGGGGGGGGAHGAVSNRTPSRILAKNRRSLCTGSLFHWIQCLGYRRWPMAKPGRRLPSARRDPIAQAVTTASLLL